MLWAAGLACAFVIATTGGSQAQDGGDALAGAALAQQVCAVCHALRQDQSNSPRADAPTFPGIARTPGLTALALTVALQSAHRKMPDLVLSQQEISDLSAFILSLRSAN